MCYVIVTSRTLLWTMLTIVTTLAMLAAIVTPQWLLGPARRTGLRTVEEPEVTSSLVLDSQDPQVYVPTLGIYNRCTKIHDIDHVFTDSCAPYITGGFSMDTNDFPHFWKAALVFLSIGLALMVFTVVTSLLGCCIRAIARKSIFTISGTVQAVAGLFFILGLLMYPAGWGTRRVQLVCGERTDAFTIGDCTLGWAFYLAVGSTLVTFLCSVLSVQAEISTSSDKVQDEILDGKNLICLL